MFLDPDPYPLVRGMDPDPDPPQNVIDPEHCSTESDPNPSTVSVLQLNFENDDNGLAV
jgi:hypothetical protein